MNFWLHEQAQSNGNRLAIVTNQLSLTYEELYHRARTVAQYLTALNQKRIGLYISNDIDSVVLIHACWLAHIEIAMINTRLTRHEMINQMNSVDITTIVHTLPLELEGFNLYHFNDLTQLDKYDVSSYKFNLESIASIMFTSGTTGPQKAVPQTFNNHLASAKGCKHSLGFEQNTVWLSVLPIYHISGLSVILRAVIEGFTVRLVKKFQTEDMLTQIKTYPITHMSLVPQTLKWLMDAGLTQPFSLEKILLGGAKLSPQLIEQAFAYRLPVYNSFGMTETCSQFLTASPQMLKERFDTVGKPSENVEVKIKNPNAYGHGELLIKGENVMNGYLYPKYLKDTFDNDGYFQTGDIAEIDDEGYVMIYDRRKDLIISGGENIYPYQIETIAKDFEGIEDAVCVGISDDTWGQVPILYYVTNQDINQNELIEHFENHLARYKIPKKYYQVESLPYTSTGKLQRKKVKSEDLNEGKNNES
ncbi:o-succinylbenzoate--CoA ligase [Staphylococcus epidermidis]|uniref:o-succinylbenzoate--CoA ligase n=1 Tax=Staphylococcus epidermidis TaxID=1282 RepID=UPI0034D46D35